MTISNVYHTSIYIYTERNEGFVTNHLNSLFDSHGLCRRMGSTADARVLSCGTRQGKTERRGHARVPRAWCARLHAQRRGEKRRTSRRHDTTTRCRWIGLDYSSSRPTDRCDFLEICFCCQDCPGLGNWSIFYPYSSVGTTITFDVIENTGSNLTSNVSCIETLARASTKTYLPGSSGIETKRVGRRTAVYGTDAPKIPPFRERV